MNLKDLQFQKRKKNLTYICFQTLKKIAETDSIQASRVIFPSRAASTFPRKIADKGGPNEKSHYEQTAIRGRRSPEFSRWEKAGNSGRIRVGTSLLSRGRKLRAESRPRHFSRRVALLFYFISGRWGSVLFVLFLFFSHAYVCVLPSVGVVILPRFCVYVVEKFARTVPHSYKLENGGR